MNKKKIKKVLEPYIVMDKRANIKPIMFLIMEVRNNNLTLGQVIGEHYFYSSRLESTKISYIKDLILEELLK